MCGKLRTLALYCSGHCAPMHFLLPSFYPDVTRVRKDTRPSLTFAYYKRQKAGQETTEGRSLIVTTTKVPQQKGQYKHPWSFPYMSYLYSLIPWYASFFQWNARNSVNQMSGLHVKLWYLTVGQLTLCGHKLSIKRWAWPSYVQLSNMATSSNHTKTPISTHNSCSRQQFIMILLGYWVVFCWLAVYKSRESHTSHV